MEKQVLIQELQEIEDKIKMYERLAKGNFRGNLNAETANAEVERLQYLYKKKTVDLSVEDRKELAQMAADKNIKLEFLFDLIFTEEEMEDYEEIQSFWREPLPEDFPKHDK